MDAVQRRARAVRLSLPGGRAGLRLRPGGPFFCQPADHCGGHRPAEGRGLDIAATPRGYLLPRPTPGLTRQLAWCPPAGGHGPGAGAHGG